MDSLWILLRKLQDVTISVCRSRRSCMADDVRLLEEFVSTKQLLKRSAGLPACLVDVLVLVFLLAIV